MATISHPKCGKSWNQRGNRTGHCSGCCETFEGLSLFDAHQRLTPDGKVICRNPADMESGKKPLRLINGTWRGPEMPKNVFNTNDDNTNEGTN